MNSSRIVSVRVLLRNFERRDVGSCRLIAGRSGFCVTVCHRRYASRQNSTSSNVMNRTIVILSVAYCFP